jgi:hypothetical protein
MKARVESVSTFIPSPGLGIAVSASTYYTQLDGLDLISIHSHISRSDTADVGYVRRSNDNGVTWTKPEIRETNFPHPDGTLRTGPSGGYVDPATGRYITITNEAVLPTDDPLEGMRQWYLNYAVSDDGGRTDIAAGQIIHEGDDYDAIHYLPGVWRGRNCVMIGDMGQRPLTRSDGTILVPVQTSPVGPDGDYHNPGAGYTWTDCMLLMGRWNTASSEGAVGNGGAVSNGGAVGTIAWTASERICGDPARTSRGMIEPTIAELSDSSLIMVMRGSNDAMPDMPGYRWISRSHDGGMTWTEPTPWTYADGTPFYSPSAMSRLMSWRDGRLFWIGNISPENPRGNSPRYPLVIGEVDRMTGLLIGDPVHVIDDRKPDESPHLTLSNFYAREDRITGGIALHMTRLFANDFRVEGKIDWTADALLYNISID